MMSCDCYCRTPGKGAYRYDDEDNWVGCIDCPCPDRTPAEEASLIGALTKLAEAMERRGVRTVGECLDDSEMTS